MTPLDLDAVLARVRAPRGQKPARTPKKKGLDLGAVIARVKTKRAKTQGFAELSEPPQKLKSAAEMEEVAAQLRPLIPMGWELRLYPGVEHPIRISAAYDRGIYKREEWGHYVDFYNIAVDEYRSKRGAVGLIQHGMLKDVVTGRMLNPKEALVWRTPTDFERGWRPAGWALRPSAWINRPWLAIFSRTEQRDRVITLRDRMGWTGPTFGEVLEAVVRDLLQPMSDGTPSREIVPVGPSFKEKRP